MFKSSYFWFGKSIKGNDKIYFLVTGVDFTCLLSRSSDRWVSKFWAQLIISTHLWVQLIYRRLIWTKTKIFWQHHYHHHAGICDKLEKILTAKIYENQTTTMFWTINWLRKRSMKWSHTAVLSLSLPIYSGNNLRNSKWWFIHHTHHQSHCAFSRSGTFHEIKN